MGPGSRFTLSALDMHAQSEGTLLHYPQALQDWLKLYQLTASNPSTLFFSQTAIVEAGQTECHSGAYSQGEQHLRQGLQEINSHGGSKAFNYSVGSLALAECMLAQREDGKPAMQGGSLRQVQQYLDSFDLPVVRSFAGTDDAQGNLYLAKARLAFQQHQFKQAQQFAEQAKPILSRPDADAWEQTRLTKLETALRGRGV